MSDLYNILMKAEKPARYIGGEFNLPDFSKPADFRFVICFPELYEVAMSNLGVRILYHMLNETEGMSCERCFAPALDFADILRKENKKLFSLETKTPLDRFDAIGMSVGYEMLYSNVLYMLDIAGIPFYSKDRGEEFPLLLMGGPCAVNPEPVADFFDAVMIGEGEEMLKQVCQTLAEHKKLGSTKYEKLKAISGIEGVYVPAFAKTEERDGRTVVVDTVVKKSRRKRF